MVCDTGHGVSSGWKGKLTRGNSVRVGPHISGLVLISLVKLKRCFRMGDP